MQKLIFFAKPGLKVTKTLDYRPLKLLKGFCKIGEYLIISRADENMSSMDFYSDLQYGFKKGCSTTDAIKDFVSSIKRKRKQYRHNIVIALYIESAF